MSPEKLKKLMKKMPSSPGIYIFKKANGPLYIGKALNLKKRVSSYLKTKDTRIQKMISLAQSLKHIPTESDIEALILESQYIKRHKPKFNIVLRDDKQYSFIVITNDKYPRIFTTHQPQNPDFINYKFIGPFTDALILKSTLIFLRKIFPYCTCKQKHNNYCLNYHIGKCPGFCCLKQPATNSLRLTAYKKNVKAIEEILSGKRNALIKKLEKDMSGLANKGDLEKAIELRDKIAKIKRVFENARIVGRHAEQDSHNKEEALSGLKKILNLKSLPRKIEGYDISNIQGENAVGAMVVFENGLPHNNSYRKFKIRTKSAPDDISMLKEMLTRRFNHPEWPYPDLVLIDGGKGQLSASLKAISNFQFPVSGPKVIALTKNEGHLGHKVILDTGKEVQLSKLPVSVKNLLIHIDSEAHRFAINYYRKLHRRTLK